ncbi:MAG: SH3 domain-containing protein [Synergistaceae bacterium]|nr:SH3 domain-containing protein [Synergistaceae bacterium]
MSGYLCGNCGTSLADSDPACPECGMPRAPRGEGPLMEADVRTDPGGALAATEEKEPAAANTQGEKTKIRPAKKKSAGFSRTVTPLTASAARKKMPKHNPLMPLFLAIALIWIGGMVFLAYRFFIPGEGAGRNGVTIEYENGGDQAFQQIEEMPPGETAQPVAPVEEIPRYVWSDADAQGYSKLIASDPSAGGEPKLGGTVTGDRVRLRSAPNTDSRIINHYNKGVKVEITQRYVSTREEHPWYNIRINGRVGWMYGQYVGDIN